VWVTIKLWMCASYMTLLSCTISQLANLLPQAHGVAVERPTGGVRAAAATNPDRKAAMRCLLFDSIQQGTQYCEECFLQVLTPLQATLQRPRVGGPCSGSILMSGACKRMPPLGNITPRELPFLSWRRA